MGFNFMVIKMARKLVFGAGTNDADYTLSATVDGKRVFCPFYKRWCEMLKRCYSKSHQSKFQTYIGCAVCDEWLTFSNFKKWMEQQDWRGKELDKDLLFVGNKLYSPETCVFVNSATNSFTIDCAASRGRYMLGVSFSSDRGKFMARCCDPFKKINEHLGRFPDELSAHLAWKKRKHEHALRLADLQEDERVAKSLRARFLHNTSDQ